jgi:hypothetical protein
MSTPIDDYVLDTLLPDLVGHDRHPSAFLVYLYLYADSVRNRSRDVARSLTEITDATGLSRRAVQIALKRLVQRRLLVPHQRSTAEAIRYQIRTPWRR